MRMTADGCTKIIKWLISATSWKERACSLTFGLMLVAYACDMEAQTSIRYETSFPAMGTTFRIVLYGEKSLDAIDVFERCENRVNELNAVFSDYDPASEISRLNGLAGQDTAVRVSNELWEVISFAREVSHLTGGAFDISIGPLSKLWRRAIRRGQLPDQAVLRQMHSRVGYRHILLDPHRRSVSLAVPDMHLDLGGIAKGYTVDDLASVLESAGITSYLIDAGGDLFMGDPPPGEEGWKIQVDPAGPGVEGGYQRCRNTAIASSGISYRYVEVDGRKYGHIVDPRSGMGISSMRVYTVKAVNCMRADAWASALAVMGKIDFDRLCSAEEGCEVLHYSD